MKGTAVSPTWMDSPSLAGWGAIPALLSLCALSSCQVVVSVALLMLFLLGLLDLARRVVVGLGRLLCGAAGYPRHARTRCACRCSCSCSCSYQASNSLTSRRINDDGGQWNIPARSALNSRQ
jgi:hypothetical protein